MEDGTFVEVRKNPDVLPSFSRRRLWSSSSLPMHSQRPRFKKNPGDERRLQALVPRHRRDDRGGPGQAPHELQPPHARVRLRVDMNEWTYIYLCMYKCVWVVLAVYVYLR